MTVVRHPPPMLLIERARDFLRGGPAPALELIASVCQLSGLPPLVAEEMADALFAPYREFARDADGRWSVTTRALARATTAVSAYALDDLPALSIGEPASPGSYAARSRASSLGSSLASSIGPLVPALHAFPYAVVDVETTGGRAGAGDRITEVAIVVVRDGVVSEVYETLVNPQRSIPRWITALTNISWDMVKDAPTFRDVAPRVLDLLEGRVFVAHNATFDWNFICAEVGRATGERLDGERLCTVRLARRLLPQLRRRSLDYVCDHYGVEITARHRAAGDAVATAQVLLRLLGDAHDRGIGSWDALRALLDRRTGRAKRRRRPPAMPRPVDRDTTA